MNKRFLIGIAVIFMIAMVSIGAVLSYRGQAQDINTCPNAANCVNSGTCDGKCDGDCDQSNCTGTCPNNNTEQKQTRTCSRTCTRN